jgi:hypothetical protein
MIRTTGMLQLLCGRLEGDASFVRFALGLKGASKRQVSSTKVRKRRRFAFRPKQAHSAVRICPCFVKLLSLEFYI